MFPPMMQITSFAISIVVLVLFLSICIICRVQSAKKKSKVKKCPQFTGPPIYYRYSPANSMDYLGRHFIIKATKANKLYNLANYFIFHFRSSYYISIKFC